MCKVVFAMEVIQEKTGGALKKKLLSCKSKAAKKGWRNPRNSQQWAEKLLYLRLADIVRKRYNIY